MSRDPTAHGQDATRRSGRPAAALPERAASGREASERRPCVCMLAAENGAIPGGKVGGIGDVIRDLPPALARAGAEVSVVVPAYGAFHELPGARCLRAFSVPFGDALERVELHELAAQRAPGVRQYALHHPLFAVGGAGRIYRDDPPGRPFASDAGKFALFSLAALAAVREGHFGPIDVLHLHDWHTALAAVLLEFDPEFAALRGLRTVYGIHNLALQGIRPLAGDPSSLERWYPRLHYRVESLVDPRWRDCVNPMAAGIRLCERVHTVSPNYAREILEPNAPERGFHGGEGLEADLSAVAADGRLVGIVNGIAAAETDAGERGGGRKGGGTGGEAPGWPAVTDALSNGLLATLGDSETLSAADYLAHRRLLAWAEAERPAHLLTSVGRLTAQKVALLLHDAEAHGGRAVLDVLLERLAGRGALVLLGAGDVELERRCQRIAARHSHFCFLRRYSERLAELLFEHGDLFLMPSSFEPCGISQMFAMREGQPPLVHAVGGLVDTVEDGVDGFTFAGASIEAQAEALLARLDEALALREREPRRWRDIVDAARARRFPWRGSAARYLDELYTS